MDKPFQRRGAASNTRVGHDFENMAQKYFSGIGMQLECGIPVEIGVNGRKYHNFDLGTASGKVVVECKSHTWTESGNVPSAKMRAWNEAMLYFLAMSRGWRKILFVLRDYNKRKNETLGHYYVRTNFHLIPRDVEVWEYDDKSGTAKRIDTPNGSDDSRPVAGPGIKKNPRTYVRGTRRDKAKYRR